jgi:hypothetical protein
MRFQGSLFVLAGIVAGVLVPGTVHACRCVEPAIGQAYRRADLVVVATIDKVGSSEGNVMKATATVSDAWKTSAPATITFISGEDCLYEVKAGQKHLLFLYRDPGGTLGTIRCRGNRPLSNAKEDLSWLKRHGKRSSVETVR